MASVAEGPVPDVDPPPTSAGICERVQLPPLRQERGGLLPDGTAGHGTGLKLVEQIARAHNGRAVLRGGEGYFCCEVWLPL